MRRNKFGRDLSFSVFRRVKFLASSMDSRTCDGKTGAFEERELIRRRSDGTGPHQQEEDGAEDMEGVVRFRRQPRQLLPANAPG